MRPVFQREAARTAHISFFHRLFETKSGSGGEGPAFGFYFVRKIFIGVDPGQTLTIICFTDDFFAVG